VQKAKDTWPHYSHPGIEADDVLGIFATRDSNTVLCSEDKDMKTIPCTLWQQGKVKKISVDEADYWFLYQTLVGDTADGYPGLPGTGPKKAEKILKGSEGTKFVRALGWSRVVDAYQRRGYTEADAIKQARLARILRSEDWDAEKKQPILWSPPS
jgi:DNA polymerase-1